MDKFTELKIQQAVFEEGVEIVLLVILEGREDLDEYFIRKDCEG